MGIGTALHSGPGRYGSGMFETFNNKTIVITGGATGIGFALAKQFAADGANLVIGEPRRNRLDEAVSELRQIGGQADCMVTDVTDPDSVERLADFAEASLGPIDIAINNAGVAQRERARLIDAGLEDVHRVFDVNLFGVWHGCRAFGRRMIARDVQTAIYNVASENSFFLATVRAAAYIASKHAVHGLTDAFREEMPDHVHVGAIFPGWVASELMPPEVRQYAMDADVFAAKVVEQIRAGETHIVTHAYNIERIRARQAEIEAAYARWAPRYDGDDEFDVRTVISRMREGRES